MAAAAVFPPSTTQAERHSGLTLKQLAGRRIVAGMYGPKAPRALLRRIHRGELSGVILYARNVHSRSQVRSLTRSLQRARPRGDPPLLVLMDQEGGLVKRLSGPPNHSAAEIGRSNSARLARHDGRAAARNLRGVGVNVDIAPVADVGRRGSYLRHLGRTYSGNPKRVARLAGAFARGLARGHVAAVAKHFPGLGTTRVDDDLKINKVRLSAHTLRHVDEVPFATLARERVPLVMLSNAIYPAFSRRPALFSRRIIAGELRDRLGFKGVAFTDDLDAPTTRRLGSAARRVLLSARAGADLILFAHSFPDVERASAALARAVRSGRLSRAKMERSVSRIRTLRESLGG